jgi:hypothetical protein
MHAGVEHGLHGQRGIVVEAIVVLDRRLVLAWVVVVRLGPGLVVLKGVLVMVVLVVHLQLAHGRAARQGAVDPR